MSIFYDENLDLPEQASKHESFKGKQSYLKRQNGHLNRQSEYYCHKELPIIIGVYLYRSSYHLTPASNRCLVYATLVRTSFGINFRPFLNML